MKLTRLFIVCIVCIVALGAAPRPSAQPEPLGELRAVQRLGKSDFPAPPLGYAVHVFAWDWRNPLALAEVERGIRTSTELPRKWTSLEGFEAEDQILIQLNEPQEQPDGRWDLALGDAPAPEPDATTEAAAALEADRQALLATPCITVGATAPWLVAGKVGGESSPLLPLLDPARDVIGTRWLRPAGRIDKLPDLKFELRCILSWTDPARGTTRFALVETAAGSTYGYFSELRDWLKAMSRPGEWFAVHSIGPNALISTDNDWVGGTVDSRLTQRAGVVLRLRPAREGENVDWARLAGARVKASSYEPGYMPDRVKSGLLWPVRMHPALWISRPLTPEKPEPAWIELEFAQPRPIEAINLIWPSIAGWSESFQPRKLTLTLTADEGGRKTDTRELDQPAGGSVRIERDPGSTLAGLRLDFTQASELEPFPRARLAGIQLWAPWDGKTTAAPLE